MANSQNGAALIGLIVTMVLLAALGAAMLSTTSTSTFNQVHGNLSTKAFDLAESGHRYAAMNFMTSSPGGDDCLSCHSSSISSTIDIKGVEGGDLSDDSIKTHGQTYTLSDGGQFKIRLAPFWFKAGSQELIEGGTLTVSALKSSDGLVQCDFPERFKTETGKPATDGGHLQIGGGAGAQYVNYSTITDNEDGTLTFNNICTDGGTLSDLTGEVNVYPTCLVYGDQALNKDGDLNVQNTQGGDIYAFPDAECKIEVNGKKISYRHVVVDGAPTPTWWKFTGLDNLDSDNPVLPFDVSDNNIVTLSECIKITSTGTYSGSSRTVVYYESTAPSMEVPIVYYTGDSAPTEYLAGGNFWWVADASGNDDAKGHNVLDISTQDGNITAAEGAPGNVYNCANSCHKTLAAAQTAVSSLGSGCEGCHQCMDHEINTSGHVTSTPWYRFLSGHMSGTGLGVQGIEDVDWQASSSAADHNEYLGYSGDKEYAAGFYYLGGTMTAYCCGCHGNFHVQDTTATGASPWLRHPSDAVIPTTGEYASMDTQYNPNTPVARSTATMDGLGDTPDGTVAPGTDMVMCLSCHAPHGSKYSDSLRWNYSGMIVGTTGAGQGKGCFMCHTDKDNSAYYTQDDGFRCYNCHTMHNSQNGSPMVTEGGGALNNHLLIDETLSCPHTAP